MPACSQGRDLYASPLTHVHALLCAARLDEQKPTGFAFLCPFSPTALSIQAWKSDREIWLHVRLWKTSSLVYKSSHYEVHKDSNKIHRGEGK